MQENTINTQDPVILPNNVKKALQDEMDNMYMNGAGDDDVREFASVFLEEYKKKRADSSTNENPSELTVSTDEPESTLPDWYEEPEWFRESGLGYSDEKARRSEIKNIYQKDIFLPGERQAGQLINRAGHDILSPEMVAEMDKYAQSYDGTEPTKDMLKRMRVEMNDKFNEGNSKFTKRNIDSLIEEGMSPILQDQMTAKIREFESKGFSRAQLAYIDPEAIKELKSEFRAKGWNGDIIDHAWNKAVASKTEAAIMTNQVKKLTKSVDNFVKDQGLSREQAANQVMDGVRNHWVKWNESKFSKKDMQRRRLVSQLDELKKAGNYKDYDHVEAGKIQDQIESIEKELDIEPRVDWFGTVIRGVKRAGLPAVEGDEPIDIDFIHGLYDKDGKRIVRKNMSESAKVDEKQINKFLDEVKDNKSFKENIADNAFNQYLIVRDIEQELEQYREFFNQNPGLSKMTAGMLERNGNEEAASKMRTMNHLENMHKSQSLKAEAYGRMYLLNQNLALTDKDEGYYLRDAGKLLLDTNNLSSPQMGSSDAELLEFTREAFDDLGVSMTQEELENTSKDVKLEISRGMAGMTDIVVKLAVLDKVAGMTGLTGVINGVKNGKTALKVGQKVYKSSIPNKIAANIMNATWEGVKFDVAGGDFGTGAMFFESQAALGQLGKVVKNPAFKTLGALLQGTVGMTASMESVALAESAIDAIREDKDVSRAIRETFGNWDEAHQRILVELITAAPFGMKAVVNARNKGIYKGTSQDMLNMAEIIAKDTTLDPKVREQAVEFLRMSAPQFETEQTRLDTEKAFRKAELLESEGIKTKKMNLKEIERAYDDYVTERTQTDPEFIDKIESTFGDMAMGKTYEPVHTRSVVEMNSRIQALRNNNTDLTGKTKKQVEKLYEELRMDKAVEYEGTNENAESSALVHTVAGHEVALEVGKKIVRKSDQEAAVREIKGELKRTKKDVNWEDTAKKSRQKLNDVLSETAQKVGKEKYVEIIEKFSGKTYDDWLSIVNEIPKTKSELLKNMDIVEDIVHKIEVMSQPRADYVGLVSNKPLNESPTITETEGFRNDIKTYKKSWKDASKVFIEQSKQLSDKLNERVGRLINNDKKFFENTGLTKTEFKALTEPLKANSTKSMVEDRLRKLESLVRKLELKDSRVNIKRRFAVYKPKEVAGERVKGTKLDYVGNSKIEVADALFNNAEGKVELLRERIKSQIEGSEGYQRDLLEAQYDALKYAGERELAIERINELNFQNQYDKLSQKELLEYEMLEFVDGNRMTRNDMMTAEANLRSIIETGESIRERLETSRKLKEQIQIESVIEDFGTTARQIEIDRASGKLGEHRSMAKKVWDSLRFYRQSIESFTSLTEYLSRNIPNRLTGEGTLVSLATDFHKAREQATSKIVELQTEQRVAAYEIFGKSKTEGGESIDRKLRSNSKDRHVLEITANDQPLIIKDMTVNNVGKLWQSSLDPSNARLFENMGWGIKNGVFDIKLVQEQLGNFITEKGGAESLKWFDWQIKTMYPKLYHIANEAHRRLNHVDLANTLNYSPLFAEGTVTIGGKEVAWKEMNDLMQESNKTGKNYFIATAGNGHLKQRGTGKRTIKLRMDADHVLDNYMKKMVHYANFQEGINRSRNILQDKNIKDVLTDREGSKINMIIDKALVDIGANDHTGNRIQVLDKWKNRFVRAHLGLNVGLLPKQLASTDAYRTGLSNAESREFLGKMVWTPQKAKYAKMIMASEFVKNRLSTVAFDANVAESIQKAGVTVAESKWVKGGKDWWKPVNLKDNMLIAGKFGDIQAIVSGGSTFMEVRVNTLRKKGMGEKEAIQQAYEDFVRVSKTTQQSPYVEDLSHTQRYGSIGRMATVFKNSPQQYLRLEMRAFDRFNQGRRDFKNADTPKLKAMAKTNMAKGAKDFIISHVVLPGMFRAASQWFYAGEEKFYNDAGLGMAMLLGSLSYAFIVGDMMNNALSQLATGHAFDVSILPVPEAIMDNFQSMIEEIGEVLNDDPITFDDVYDFVQFPAEAFGVPVSGITLGKGISDYLTGKTDDERALFGASGSVQGQYDRSYQYPEIKASLAAGESRSEFMQKMKSKYDADVYNRSKSRWAKEYHIYDEFGGHNPDVNALYSGRMTNKQKAKYLYRLKYGKPTEFTMGSVVRSLLNTEEGFDEFVKRLRRTDVISSEVMKELRKIEKEKSE